MYTSKWRWIRTQRTEKGRERGDMRGECRPPIALEWDENNVKSLSRMRTMKNEKEKRSHEGKVVQKVNGWIEIELEKSSELHGWMSRERLRKDRHWRDEGEFHQLLICKVNYLFGIYSSFSWYSSGSWYGNTSVTIQSICYGMITFLLSLPLDRYSPSSLPLSFHPSSSDSNSVFCLFHRCCFSWSIYDFNRKEIQGKFLSYSSVSSSFSESRSNLGHFVCSNDWLSYEGTIHLLFQFSHYQLSNVSKVFKLVVNISRLQLGRIHFSFQLPFYLEVEKVINEECDGNFGYVDISRTNITKRWEKWDQTLSKTDSFWSTQK